MIKVSEVRQFFLHRLLNTKATGLKYIHKCFNKEHSGKKPTGSSWLLLAVLIFPSLLSAQEYFFRSFSIEEGLPQSSVFCAIEDQRGEMWIGTDGSGLCRFNGVDISIFNVESGLSGNIIRSVFEDSHGNIWIGTDAGLDMYDGYSISRVADSLITETTVLAINEGPDGNIWVGTQTAGLFIIDRADSTHIENYTVANGLISMFVFDIDFDQRGNAWLSMIGGINVLSPDSGSGLKVKKLVKGIDIPSDFIICGGAGPDGKMWFGSRLDGLFSVETDEELAHFQSHRLTFLSFLETETIWDVHWTEKGECYVATDNQGVIGFDANQVKDRLDRNHGLATNQVYRITESKDGSLWFSTLGNGILRFESKKIITYSAGKGITGNQVTSIAREGNKITYTNDQGLFEAEIVDDQLIVDAAFKPYTQNGDFDFTSLDVSGDTIWIGSFNGVYQLANNQLTRTRFNNQLSSLKINCVLNDSRNRLWIGTDNGYNLVNKGSVFSLNEDQGFINNEVQTIFEHSSGPVFMGTLGGLVRIDGNQYRDFNREDGLTETSIHSLAEQNDGTLWIGTFGGGLFYINSETDSIPIKPAKGNYLLSSQNIYSMVFLTDKVLIAGTEDGFNRITLNDEKEIISVVHFNVEDGFPEGKNSLNAIAKDQDGIIWFGTSNGLVRYSPEISSDMDVEYTTHIRSLKLFFEEVDWQEYGELMRWYNLPKNLILSHNNNHLTIGFVVPYFGNVNDISYSYYLEGQGSNWSPYQSNREVVLPGMQPGKYNFRVKAKNRYGVVGPEASFKFTIRPPFWKRTWFIVSSVIVLIIMLIVSIRMRTRQLQKEKMRLEEIVKERTKEVVEQKEEIEKQHNIVKNQNLEIESSIMYAERIQKAVIPSQEILNSSFPETFILFRPQHIVSGDFYWAGKKNDCVVFAAVDCTGHGVPGAFMSMLGISYLNQIVLEEGFTTPGKILNHLRNHIIASFSQREQDIEDRKDGMDASLCSYNTKTKQLLYAGAYNSLIHIRQSKEGLEILEYDADRMPVGLYARMNDFTTHEIQYEKGDIICLYSDGYPDQFGGLKFKKFMKRRFKQLLLEHADKPLAEQRQILNQTLEKWMAFTDPDGEPIIQTDDILVMGVKL